MYFSNGKDRKCVNLVVYFQALKPMQESEYVTGAVCGMVDSDAD